MPTLSFEEFTKNGPNGIPRANNFILHFVDLPDLIPNYRKKPALQYLISNNPLLAQRLTETITKYYRENQGKINTQKIFEQTKEMLYEAYRIMRQAGFTNEELFA